MPCVQPAGGYRRAMSGAGRETDEHGVPEYSWRCKHCDKPFKVCLPPKWEQGAVYRLNVNCPWCRYPQTVDVRAPEQVFVLHGVHS